MAAGLRFAALLPPVVVARSLSKEEREWWQQPARNRAVAQAIKNFEEDDSFFSPDSGLLLGPASSERLTHVIYDSLGSRTNAVSSYRVFAKREGSEVKAVASFSDRGVSGHPGIVHGGLTALLFDNTFGWTNFIVAMKSDEENDIETKVLETIRQLTNDTTSSAMKSTTKIGFTANLSVNYRKPVPAESAVLITTRLEVLEGRKRKLSGTMVALPSGTHLADATALFILPRDKPPSWWRSFLSRFF